MTTTGSRCEPYTFVIVPVTLFTWFQIFISLLENIYFSSSCFEVSGGERRDRWFFRICKLIPNALLSSESLMSSVGHWHFIISSGWCGAFSSPVSISLQPAATRQTCIRFWKPASHHLGKHVNIHESDIRSWMDEFANILGSVLWTWDGHDCSP